MNKEVEAKIESQNVIGEANSGSYRPVRFSRIKYKACPDTHIDIRQYQRGYDDDGEEVFYPTKKGFRFQEREFRRVIKEYTLVPQMYIHPRIVDRCFKLLQDGEFESAVLQAFKAIETSIRDKISADPEDVGIKLIRRAFNADTGALTDLALPKAEREAFSNYIAGAFGFYKNPCSHRDVEMDFITAFDRIAVASDLLKTIDQSKLNRDQEA